MPFLIVTSPEGDLSQRFLVREERFTIGRSHASAVAIRDKSVSKVHVVIARTPEGYVFQDLWSQNGTFLNEERRQSGIVRDGDILRLGRVQILFKCDDGVPSLAGPAGGEQGESRERRGGLRPGRSWRRVLAVVALGALGILLGLLAGRVGSYFSPEEPKAPSAAPLESIRPAPEGPAAGEDAPALAAGEPSPGGSAEAEAEKDAEAEKLAAAFRAGPAVPYGDADESSRVLFRLFLDLAGRPPTRAEALELSPLDHAARFARVRALSPPAEGREVPESCRRLLDRAPSVAERRALEASLAPGGAEPLDPGLLLTASAEYRQPRLGRQRSLSQRAASLIVDLLDRPPASAEEQRELEAALEEYPGGQAVARVLLHSPDGVRALAANAPAAGDAAARDWITLEVRRFLLRGPSEDEVRALARELGSGPAGFLSVRLALASAPSYRRY